MRSWRFLHALLMLFVWLPFEAALAAPAVLFHDVSVVDVIEGRASEHRDVLVRDGRIESVDVTTRRPRDANVLVVDGRGRYLMPGLAEMHVHLPPAALTDQARDMLFLLVANGVTTIRSTVGNPSHLVLRRQVEQGEVLGPRMYLAAQPLKADNTTDLKELAERIRGYAAEKYDFLKLHPSIQRPALDVIARTAKSSGINFEGHVPESVGLEYSLKAGMRAVDHIDGYVQALAGPDCKTPAAPGFFGIAYTQCVQLSRLPGLLEQTKANGTWIIPTLAHLNGWTHVPDWEALAARPQMRYLPKATLEQWRERHALLMKDAPERGQADRFIEVMQTVLREMHAKGIPIALGSDTPQAFNLPGDSTVEEMILSVQAGLTPAQVLRIATVNPARFMGAENSRGAVRAGMEADLILIEDNPLADVSAVRKLQGVMVRGRWLDRSTIDRNLDAVAKRAAAPAGS